MLRDQLSRFTTEHRAKIAWIGKSLFIGLMVALIGSMVLEMGIYSSADKLNNYLFKTYNTESFK